MSITERDSKSKNRKRQMFRRERERIFSMQVYCKPKDEERILLVLDYCIALRKAGIVCDIIYILNTNNNASVCEGGNSKGEMC